MTIVSRLNICVNWQKKEENDTNKEELMKLKYKLLDKLHNVSNSEMDLLVWVVQHSDERSGTMYGAYYRNYCDEYGRCKQSFYNALYGLKQKGIVAYRRNRNDACTTSDYDITVLDNAYPWKGSKEVTYRNEGYVDLANPVFRSQEFKSLKAKEKYLALEFRKRSFETGKGYKHGVKAFYEMWSREAYLGVSERTIRSYMHTLSKVCNFFSIGIKDGFYRITSRISSFRKPQKGQYGHIYDQDMYNEQYVRMALNRDNIKYNAESLSDTVHLIYQYGAAFANKGADVKRYIEKAIHSSVAGTKWRERELSAATVHYNLKALLQHMPDTQDQDNKKVNTSSGEKGFNNFNQRDYDWNEIENLLFNSTI